MNDFIPEADTMFCQLSRRRVGYMSKERRVIFLSIGRTKDKVDSKCDHDLMTFYFSKVRMGW